MPNVFYEIMKASNEMIDAQTVNQTNNTELIKSYLSIMNDNLVYFQDGPKGIHYWANKAHSDRSHSSKVQADSAEMSSISNQSDNMKAIQQSTMQEMSQTISADSTQSSNMVQSMESGIPVYSTLNNLLSQPM